MTESFGKFFLPGPTEVHPDVLATLSQPMIAHRGREMDELLGGMRRPMKELFRTQKFLLLGNCAATGFMEMAIRSGVRHRVLSLIGGAFGERFAAIGSACGRDVVKLNVPLGKTVEPDMLRDALTRSDVDAVTVVHSETATGALAPLESLAEVVKDFDDVMLLVDGVTSVAGSPVETEKWGLDFVFTGTQKAMALPPGLALGAASPRLLERAQTIPERGAYLDLVTHVKAFDNGQPTNTPTIPLLYGLREQFRRIDEAGGIEARWSRHKDMLDTVEAWMANRGEKLGFSYLPDEERRSWTVSCLNVPEGYSGRDLSHSLRDKGWTLAAGYGELRPSTIRIGHMGDHTVAELEGLLAMLEAEIE